LETAPADSKPILGKLKDEVGFLPNLAAAMSESPRMLEAFMTLRDINRRGSFNPVEREVIAIAVSFETNCSYCMAAHSTFAKMTGASENLLGALRSGQSPVDQRLATLSNFARQVVSQKGQVTKEELQSFLKAGFTKAQLLEVLVTISMTTLANYMSHIANPPVDEVFQAQVWAASA
jgi:uncharacterized peroxidase-related enzyme